MMLNVITNENITSISKTMHSEQSHQSQATHTRGTSQQILVDS